MTHKDMPRKMPRKGARMMKAMGASYGGKSKKGKAMSVAMEDMDSKKMGMV